MSVVFDLKAVSGVHDGFKELSLARSWIAVE
jgi:hypothetical protein